MLCLRAKKSAAQLLYHNMKNSVFSLIYRFHSSNTNASLEYSRDEADSSTTYRTVLQWHHGSILFGTNFSIVGYRNDVNARLSHALKSKRQRRARASCEVHALE